MVTTPQLLTLAHDYMRATNRGLTGISLSAAGNEKTLSRLSAGLGANTKTIEKAARWFSANWPDDIPWPAGIPRPQAGDV